MITPFMKMTREQSLPPGDSGSNPTPDAPGEIAPGGVEQVYQQYAGLLVGIARRRFGIAADECEALVHDVFVNYIRYRDEVDSPRAWLIGAMVKASCHHLRKQGKTTSFDAVGLDQIAKPGGSGEQESLDRSILVRQLLGYLGEECRDLLRLHYLDGRTASEMAVLLGTTEGYAKKMIHKCLVRVRELYAKSRGLM